MSLRGAVRTGISPAVKTTESIIRSDANNGVEIKNRGTGHPNLASALTMGMGYVLGHSQVEY